MESTIERLLTFIRPAVRNEHAYRVGGFEGVPVKLNQNESPFDLPEDFKKFLLERFLAIPWNRYPSEQPELLRHALAQRHGRDPGSILIGKGSNELTYTFGLTMVERGTPVVLPQPLFSLYEKVIRLHEGRLVRVDPRPDLSFDAEALLNAIRAEQPSLVILGCPNNPTGKDMPTEEIEYIAAETPGFVVVDEAYIEFTDRQSALKLLDRYPNVIVLRTFSKALGLAGLRVGYLVGHPAVMLELAKSRLPFLVDRLAETVALALLDHPEIVSERVAYLRRGRDDLYAKLATMDSVEAAATKTNFVIFKTPLPPARVLSELAKRSVLVRDISSYPFLDGYLRVNAGTEAENNAFLAALNETLENE